ncbi:MAG TPA: DUF799 family lipoprotein [Syntrophales bacterium]|nr:DUF799 family lipoprotein [Syntrophales bacterium]HNS53882.1 DUF799 family lipoprotein [Syntrophales bacterium]HQL90986.1 DUF799 family lipoprotein [Syntrophales bacterium]
MIESRTVRQSCILILGVALLQGCSMLQSIPVIRDLPYVSKAEEERPAIPSLGVKTIAVLPVDIKAGSSDAARMIREKLLQELYFKGYPKVPFEMVDAALAEARRREGAGPGTVVGPQVIGGMLGAEAVLYTTLLEAGTTYRYVYAPVTVRASFEIRSVQTGETIWKHESRATDRDYGVTKSSLDLGSAKIFEDVVFEVVRQAVEKLPDGPAMR